MFLLFRHVHKTLTVIPQQAEEEEEVVTEAPKPKERKTKQKKGGRIMLCWNRTFYT